MLEQCCSYSKQCYNAVLCKKSLLRIVSCNITFMEDVNKRRRIFLSLSKHECGAQEINSREIRLHLTFFANWNRRGKVCQKLEFILKLNFSLPSPLSSSIGSFSNDGGDGNENVKSAIGLLSKTTSWHVHHAFLYISLPLLHDHDVKMPNFTFYGGRKQATTKFSFSF